MCFEGFLLDEDGDSCILGAYTYKVHVHHEQVKLWIITIIHIKSSLGVKKEGE